MLKIMTMLLAFSGLPTDCADYPLTTLGTYLIQLEGGKPIMGLCEPENNGNWLVSDVVIGNFMPYM